MSIEENKAIINAWVEQVWNQKDLTAVDAFLVPDYVEHNLAQPDETGTREGARQSIAAFLSACPDCHVTYDDVFAEGDRVAVRLTCHATHTGAFAGIAPTGKQITIMGLSIARIADAKIAEMWEIIDFPGLMVQIGATP